MRQTKSSILTSLISLVLCITMLLGTTFAWFTDVVTSGSNIIASGKLEAQLHWSDKLLPEDSKEWHDAESEAVFNYNLWEPGYTELRYVKVSNNGSLNFKWKLSIKAEGQVTDLSDIIDVYYVNPVTNELTKNDLSELTPAGTLTDILANNSGETGRLAPGTSSILAIAFHMDELAGNDYQGKTLCENGFSLNLLATQDIGESDSFGDDYDADAEWPGTSLNFNGSASLTRVPVIYGALANNITIDVGNGISADLPVGVKIAEGASSLDLTVTGVEADGNLSLDNGANAISYDVHISGIASDNTTPMIVNLGAVLQAGLTDTELKLYHNEGDTPVLMTRVGSADDFAIHNQYTYDSETGNVSIYVANFSVFSAVKTSASRWMDETVADTSWYSEDGLEFELGDVADFLGFRDLVDGGNNFAGKTVKLATDIDLAGKLFNPIGGGWAYNGGNAFGGTFDGGNHTIYNAYVNGWELDATGDTHSGTSKGAGLFSSIHNATIKNLAIIGGEMVVETTSIGVVVGCAQGECTFENIVVSDVNLGNYQMRNGGIVGDIYVIESDEVKGEYSHTFKNVVVDSSVKLSSMWGDFDTGNGGVVGGRYGSSTVYMENVIVACELDVFSDVTAAYQWYAYRRCGMLVGYTGQNSPKQATNASADFLTCVNVNVYYGDWINYTYYQFANQDNSTGRRYPWVRAEEGEYNGAFSNVRYGVPTHTVEGNVIKVNQENKDTYKTGFAAITFNQLYGGGQGVYGTNNHEGKGVTIHYNLEDSKTIYIHNNANWENLKLQYWFANGNDTWTTIVDGIDMSPMLLENGIYKVEIPAYACGFKVIADDKESEIFDLSKIENNTNCYLGKVATVGDISYSILADAINNADGKIVTLLEDVVLTESIVIDGKNVTIDLAGNTINAAFNAEIVEVLLVKNGANVTITGEGTMKATGNGADVDHVEVISAIDGATVVIENGTFISNGCTAIYATRGASVTINGGYFDATEKYDGRYFTLDINELETDGFGEIIVNGGTYKNFDPANHTTDGPNYTNKLSKGLHSVKEGDIYTVAKHSFVYGVCSCGAKYYYKEKWVLVTDASDLNIGDSIVIVANDFNIALSTTQNNNNRAGVEVDKNSDGTLILNNAIQVIVLQTGLVDGTFAFCVGDNNYLYAASSASNHLKTQDEIKENGSWSISISEGVAYIVASENSRNVMQYNSNNDSPIFSCYASASQSAIAIYKLVVEESIIESHNCQDYASDATCTQNSVCGICGEEISDTKLNHNEIIDEGKAATCTETGLTEGKHCDICKEVIVAQTEIPATGHTFVGGVCDCGEVEYTEPETSTNRYYIATKRTSGNYFFMTSNLGTASTKRYTAVDSGLTKLPDYISSAEDGYVFVLINNNDGTYSIQAEGVKGNNYLGWTSGNSGTLVAESNAIKFTLDETNEGQYNIHFKTSDAERYLALNANSGNDYFAWYKSGQKQDLILIPVVDGGSEGGSTVPEHVCEHICNECSLCTDNDCTESACANKCKGHVELTEKKYSYTFTSKQYSANGTKTLGEVSWSVNGNGGYWGYDSTKGQQFGSGSKPYKSLTLTSEEFSNISSITINTSGASDIKGSVKVYVGDTFIREITLTEKATSYTIEASNLSGEVKFEYTQTSSKAIYIKSIVIEYAE